MTNQKRGPDRREFEHRLAGLLLGLLAGFIPASSALAFTVEFTAFPPSPRPVGSDVFLQVTVPDAPGADLRYRFEYSSDGQNWTMVSDFNPISNFPWAYLEEGDYFIRATVADRNTAEVQAATLAYSFASLGAAPVVVPTRHPLMALFGSPPCPAGAALRVRFWAGG